MLRLNIDVRLVKKLLDEGRIVNSNGRDAIIIDVDDVNFYTKNKDNGLYNPVCELISNL